MKSADQLSNKFDNCFHEIFFNGMNYLEHKSHRGNIASCRKLISRKIQPKENKIHNHAKSLIFMMRKYLQQD